MELLEKISQKKAKIGIIGLGYVGLPLSIEFFKAGFTVTGFDVDPEKIALLEKGQSYIRHIDVSMLRHGSSVMGDGSEEKDRGPGTFVPVTDFSLLTEMDCILVCVPTPLNKNREPDMSYVFDTGEIIAGHMTKGQLIVLESTTYPGTTDEDLKGILEGSGLKAGIDFFLAFSPEREDPNNKDFSLNTVPKIVGGFSAQCLEAAAALYGTIVSRVVPVSSTKVAEAAKLLENIYRSVNIALVNELKILFDKMGIDIWEVINAAATKPFGFHAFYPGPGLGGHCIPIDPFYLTWKAREYDFHTRFIELAGEINMSMPDFVVSKVIKALNDIGRAVANSKILILGLAYKGNVDDTRESPSFHIMEKLEKLGAIVEYHDPYIPVIKPTREYGKYAGKRSVEVEGGFDTMVIATPHDVFREYNLLKFKIPVVDTRNIITNKNSLKYKA